jgi:Zn-dependent protease
MLRDGYLTIGRYRGIPLRVHVMTPLGALVFSAFRFEPGTWLAYFLLILLHEIGHALLVMRYRLGVLSVDIQAFGGSCRWSGPATDKQRSVIAWGGVLAQAAVWLLTFGVVAFAGPPRSLFWRDFVYVFTTTNLWLIALNLLPFAPLDGGEAWKITRFVGSSFSAGRFFDRIRSLGRRGLRTRSTVSPDEARRIAKAFEDAIRRR